MGATQNAGPNITYGQLVSHPSNTPNAPEEGSLLIGPNAEYQGSALLDPRFPVPKDSPAMGRLFGFLDSPYVCQVDTVPAASAAVPVNVAAAQAPTNGTALTLAGASAGVTPAVPFFALNTTAFNGNTYPAYASVPTLSGVTLDFGFGILSTTAGSTAATVPAGGNALLLYPGQPVAIGTVGAAGGTLMTKIVSVNYLTGAVVLGNAAQATNAAAPIGQGYPLSVTSAPNPSAAAPRMAAGVLGLWDPLQMVSRNVGISGSSGATGGAFLVRGHDVYGMPMSELITAAAGAGPTYGKKAFKHIASITPQFTDATHNYSVGTGDTFGFSVRTDKIEYTNLYVSGAIVGSNTGFIPADTTNPATSATGDVRGTFQVGPRGAGTGFGANPTNGTLRIAIFMTIPLFNLVMATAQNASPMFGNIQA